MNPSDPIAEVVASAHCGGQALTDRSIKGRDVTNSVVVTGDGNWVALVLGNSGVVLPLVRKQIRPPDRRRRLEAGDRRELDVLVPERRAVPLVARGALLDDLATWLEDDFDISVRALTGRAGTGKTRLAIELCARVDGAYAVGNWAAGFLSPAEIPSIVEVLATRSFEWERPTLLVVDYAAQVYAELGRWLDWLVPQERIGTKLRFLLLEREAPEGFGWWKELTAPGSNAGAQRADLFWDTGLRPVELPGLAGLEDRRQVLSATLVAAAAVRGTTPPAGIPGPGVDGGFDTELGGQRFGNPLSLMMAGVLALERSPRDALALRRLDAARRLAGRELARLQAMAGAGNAPAMTHLAAFNGLAGGLPVAGLRTALAGELSTVRIAGDAGRIASLLQQEFPAPQDSAGPATQRLGTVQPDLIGEGLIVEALSGEPTVEAGAPAMVVRAYALGRELAAEALIRLLQDYAYALEDATATRVERDTAERLMGWLVTLANSSDDLEVLEPLAFKLPDKTLVLREIALALDERVERLAREAFQRSGRPNDASRAAVWSMNLGNRLFEANRRVESRAALERSYWMHTRLCEIDANAFLPSLAMAAHNLSLEYRWAGMSEQALSTADESVRIRRDLVAGGLEGMRPDLGLSLRNRARILRDTGRNDDALRDANEAVGYLAGASSDEHLHYSAMAHQTRASSFRALEMPQEAVVNARSAVEVYRGLAARLPDAYTGDLSDALEIQSTMEEAAGDRALAFDTAREAVRVLMPEFLTRPRAGADLMARKMSIYEGLSNRLGEPMDPSIFNPINEAFRQLRQEDSK